jgi:TonB family protein
MLLWCSAPKKDPHSTVVATVGATSLELGAVQEALPDSGEALDSVRREAGVRRVGLALFADSVPGVAVDSQTVAALAVQLTRRSDAPWSVGATQTLLKAALMVQKLQGSDRGALPAAVVATLDSLLVPPRSKDAAEPSRGSGVDTVSVLGELLQAQLGLSAELSAVLVEFVGSTAGEVKDSASVAKLIRGLVQDTTAQQARGGAPRGGAGTLAVKDNSELALKYRPAQSIQDSILRHTPAVMMLYKKQLKQDAALAGVVMVRFRVGADGVVQEVVVARSSLDAPAFITPLLDYLKDIRFAPIPAKIGAMSFEFPFEFTPES